MTKDLDLSTMKSKEILPQYRDQLEAEIKDIFLWAIGQNAITEMTKTVIERTKLTTVTQTMYTIPGYISPRKETSTIVESIFFN